MRVIKYKTRIVKQTNRRGEVEYMPQYKKGLFGSWQFLSVDVRYDTVKSVTFTHWDFFDADKSVTVTFDESPRTLKNAKIRIDEFIKFINHSRAFVLGDQITSREIIKYP